MQKPKQCNRSPICSCPCLCATSDGHRASRMRAGSNPIASQKYPIPKSPPNTEKPDHPYLLESAKIRPNGPHTCSLIRSVCSLQFDTVLRQTDRTGCHLSCWHHSDLDQHLEELHLPHLLTIRPCSQEIPHRGQRSAHHAARAPGTAQSTVTSCAGATAVASGQGKTVCVLTV